MKAYAEGGTGKASATRTADDRAYTAWAKGQAASAGVRNPSSYVNRNVTTNTVSNRNRVVGALNRGTTNR